MAAVPEPGKVLKWTYPVNGRLQAPFQKCHLALTRQVAGLLAFSGPLLPICYITDDADSSRGPAHYIRKDIKQYFLLQKLRRQHFARRFIHSSVNIKTLKQAGHGGRDSQVSWTTPVSQETN